MAFKIAPVLILALDIGQGFIMLLSGEPGVGKTLTVEAGTNSRS